MAHRPRKRFGQHFLHDPGVIRRILAVVAPQPGDRLVEIGPGLGALTCPLLARVGELDVIEIDRDLVPALQRRCGELGRLQIHQADALHFDLTALGQGAASLRLLGNLPYNISTPLLFHLLDAAECIRDMHFMLQREVVERIVACPGCKDYGRLSVMMQYRCRAQMLFTVGPGAFRPPPKVHSAMVRLVPHTSPAVEVDDQRVFTELVAKAFSQRRKTLGRILRGLLEPEPMARLGIDPSARPETLDLAQFAQLANALARNRPPPAR
jgi:16S rRNA (adenine1518-N6/adenine1519-N6)-dimethyltransferase